MFTRQQLHELAQINAHPLVSIYLPTHSAARETRQDPIRLKNLCDDAERRLLAHGTRRDDAQRLLEPARSLIADGLFWRRQSAGLALLLGTGPMRIIRAPVSFEEHVFVGDRFAIRPLVAAIEDPTSFFVLAIHQNAVRLLHCTREHAREIDRHDIPRSLADAVGYDWEQESLQFHTRAQKVGSETSHGAATSVGQRTGVDRAAMHHGHGGGGDADVRADEIEQFLKRVDAGVTRLLNEHREPLVLAAAEPIRSRFRNIATHPRLVDADIEGNTEHFGMGELHRKALDVMAPRFKAPTREVLDRFVEIKASDRAVEGIHDVLSILQESRAEALLANPKRPVWGAPKDDPNSQDDERGDDLLDLAIHQALARGATVHPFEDDHAPTDEPVAATLRY
jgi:hypothetical protein